VTKASLDDLSSRLYEAYTSQHAGRDRNEAAALVCRRDIHPLLPPPATGPVVAPGCGRGELVQLLQAAETGKLRAHIVALNLTFVARNGVKHVQPTERNPA
jgi:hypothetical protein